MKKIFIIILACVFSLIACVGCGESDVNNTEKVNSNETDEKVVLYISGSQKMVDELEAAFEKDRGDVLEIYHNGCGPIKQKVWSEMESGNIQADIVWAAEPSMYIELQEQNKLLKYKSPLIKKIKDEYENLCTGYFTPVNARYGVIAYNKNLVSEKNIPKAFEDLKDKYYKGKVAISDPKQSSTAAALNVALYQMFDNKFEYHKSLDENGVLLIKSNTGAVEKVESGEVYACIAPHDGIVRIKKMTNKKGVESPLCITWPKEGAISIQRPIAIIDKPSRKENKTQIAKEFVDFALSEKAQSISSKYGFVSVLKDFPLPKYIPENIKTTIVDWDSSFKDQKLLMEKYNEIYQGK